MKTQTALRKTLIGLAISAAAFNADAADGNLAPTAYASEADSPFNGTSFDYWYLENFEDEALNTLGVSVSNGYILAPRPLTDSVDGDDGVVDGQGSGGHSFYPKATFATFTFNGAALGKLPTHAGLVWTDVGYHSGGSFYAAPVTFEAFDANGVSLGVTSPLTLGDGLISGQTDEDRFFGVVNMSGISAITISMLTSNDWELDHLQYGAASLSPLPANPVPLPAGLWLLGSGLVALARFRRGTPSIAG